MLYMLTSAQTVSNKCSDRYREVVSSSLTGVVNFIFSFFCLTNIMHSLLKQLCFINDGRVHPSKIWLIKLF